MRIAIDAMGGDKAPAEIVRGTLKAAENGIGDNLVLVGDRKKIAACMNSTPVSNKSLTVVHAQDIVAMDESPLVALKRKRNSSITVAVRLHREGKADAVISAGNTGAAVACTTLYLNLLRGVKRAGIAVPLPADNESGVCVLIDCGANLKCKPIHLIQYAAMGAVYSKYIVGVEKPRIGLVNVGSEGAKGTQLLTESYALLQKEPSLNFIGNIEGQEIFKGKCDVAVCDGFTGNTILKVAEGMGEGMLRWFRRAFDSYTRSGGDNKAADAVFGKLNRLGNFSEYGGAPLLGINGVCIISHGRSDAGAIYNAIKVASDIVKKKINEHIEREIERLHIGFRWWGWWQEEEEEE